MTNGDDDLYTITARESIASFACPMGGAVHGEHATNSFSLARNANCNFNNKNS